MEGRMRVVSDCLPRRIGGAAAVACALVPAANAAAPALKVPQHLNFGNARTGSSIEHNVTLTNRTARPMRIYGIGVSSDTGSFTIGSDNHCTGVTLAPHGSCTYGIIYAPLNPGRQTGRSDIEFGPTGIAFITLSAHANASPPAAHPAAASAPAHPDHAPTPPAHAQPHASLPPAAQTHGHGHNK
jgi:hypothetical protein